MDFLDPRKQHAHMVRLLVGYMLIGVAVLIATMILLYQAYGFGLGKDGEVIQKGLVFVSTSPASARIYLDGKLYKSNTNTKLQLPAGQYTMELQRDGYNTWQRLLTVEGGGVQHFDYPKLFPAKVVSTPVRAYPVAPAFATQSPDRRWVLVQQTAAPLSFDLYDVADPKKVTSSATVVNIPDAAVTNAKAGAHSWKLVEWSTDNRHIVVQHTYTAEAGAEATEYVLIDRQTPENALNLTKTLNLSPTKQLALHDKKFDKYYVYDTVAKTVGTTSIADAGKVTPLLDHVLAYKPYGADMVLYVSDQDSTTGIALDPGKVVSMLLDNGQTYKIREHNAAGPFLIDLAEYDNNWYVAVGAASDDKVYIYKNLQRVRKASQTALLVPVRILRITAPNQLQFSSNTEFVMAENGTNFASYDAETDKGYTYTSKYPVDMPATHAAWMDSDRITYVSGGKLAVFDYDNLNGQTIAPASPDYTPFYDRDYKYVYTLVPTTAPAGVAATSGGMTLTSTSLLAPADQ
jgi:hypothetical protein